PPKAATPSGRTTRRSGGVTEFVSFDLYSKGRMEKAVTRFNPDENHNGVRMESSASGCSSVSNATDDNVAPQSKNSTVKRRARKASIGSSNGSQSRTTTPQPPPPKKRGRPPGAAKKVVVTTPKEQKAPSKTTSTSKTDAAEKKVVVKQEEESAPEDEGNSQPRRSTSRGLAEPTGSGAIATPSTSQPKKRGRPLGSGKKTSSSSKKATSLRKSPPSSKMTASPSKTTASPPQATKKVKQEEEEMPEEVPEGNKISTNGRQRMASTGSSTASESGAVATSSARKRGRPSGSGKKAASKMATTTSKTAEKQGETSSSKDKQAVPVRHTRAQARKSASDATAGAAVTATAPRAPAAKPAIARAPRAVLTLTAAAREASRTHADFSLDEEMLAAARPKSADLAQAIEQLSRGDDLAMSAERRAELVAQLDELVRLCSKKTTAAYNMVIGNITMAAQHVKDGVRLEDQKALQAKADSIESEKEKVEKSAIKEKMLFEKTIKQMEQKDSEQTRELALLQRQLLAAQQQQRIELL
ncbi:hypothetical protein PMAYCL1PPCAC_04287, partial [Pristionchus mayeri]